MALNLKLTLLLLVACILSLSLGSAEVSLVQGLFDYFQANDSASSIIITEVRIPRTSLAILCGASLGLAGAALQGLLRNPLADPGLVGASQGAAVGAALIFYFGLGGALSTFFIPLAGLVGAAIALGIVLVLAGASRPILLILAGLAVSTLAGSLLAVILNFAPNPYAMQELVFWLLGSVQGRSIEYSYLSFVGLVIGFVLLIPMRKFIYALSLGDEVAQSMGFNLKRCARQITLAAAILVGCSVAAAGNIGFVGLIIPHLLRPFTGQLPHKLLVPSALGGAALVCFADLLVRLLPVDRELKLGVVTSLIGAPLFIWLIAKERRKWI